MKQYLSTAMAAALVVSLGACDRQAATSNEAAAETAPASLEALNGTWTVDLASLKFGGKPNEYMLKDGSYTCASCIPAVTVPADGAFHPVADQPYYDSMSVKIVDPNTIEIHRKKGDKEVGVVTQTVAGDKMTTKFKDMTVEGAPVEGSGTATRVGAATDGAHAVSGKWQTDKIGDYSKEALDMTFAVEGDTVKSTVQGQSYEAMLGGPAVAVQNDPGGTMVKVERADGGLKETYSRDGKDVGVVTIVPNADGQTISYSSSDPRDGSTTDFTARKKG